MKIVKKKYLIKNVKLPNIIKKFTKEKKFTQYLSQYGIQEACKNILLPGV